jgi:hypothetical protein
MKIGRLAVSPLGAGCRVGVEIAGTTVWFESSDIRLRPAPEAFGSAFLIPALQEHERLAFDDPVCPVWLENIERLMAVFSEWWRLPVLAPQARPATDAGRPRPGSVLCFSGGVDSFYSLLGSGRRFDGLVALHGFDIFLKDIRRMSPLDRSVREVAAATGTCPIVIRTNLREHPMFESSDWNRTHGGALAAVGHLLGDFAGELCISSSHTLTNESPLGSHWRTDGFWSSSRTQVAHIGAERSRSDKIKAIAGQPLVRTHLRVCWENRAPTGNCSTCEKCVRTRLVLADCGELANHPNFDGEATLLRDVERLPHTHGIDQVYKDLLRSPRTDERMLRAIRALMARDRSAQREAARGPLGRIAAGALRRMSRSHGRP